MPSENQGVNVDRRVPKDCEPGHGFITQYVKRYTIAGGATKDKRQDPCQVGGGDFVATRPRFLDPANDGV